MKRFVSFFLVLTMVFSLCACGGTKEPSDQGASIDVGDEAALEVDEGLLNVDVTLPATFFEEETEEEIKAYAEEAGFKNCVVNEDGSVTYTMSKTKHKEFLKEMKVSLDESIAGLVNGEDAVESFQKIEYTDDCSKFDVYVDPATYTDWDSLYVLMFYMSGAYYQAFEGKDMNDVDVVVNFINNETNEVFESASYRDWIESE